MTHTASHSEDYQPVFVGKVLDELQTVLKRYPTKQAALLPALWIAQREQGWISDRVMAEVAEVLGITPAYVKGVVTFYTMYHQHPVGKNFVQVCTTSPCNICGAEGLPRAQRCRRRRRDEPRRQVDDHRSRMSRRLRISDADLNKR